MTALSSPPDLSLNEAFSSWKTAVVAELKGVPFEKRLVTRTPDDIALQPLYTRLDVNGLRDLGSLPGEAPFLRGTRRGGGGRSWQIAQEIAASQTTEYNEALLANLQRGQDAVVLRPDDDGRGGADGCRNARIPLQTVEHFSTALAGVDLHAVPVHLYAGADPRAFAALYLAFAQDRGMPFNQLTGSVAADPLAAVAETGQFPANPEQHYDGLADWTRWAAENAPQLQTIGVDAALWGDSGATATQELAIALGCAAEYLRALLTRGIPLDVAATRIRFNFAIGAQFFTEIAKFRAFRPLWTRVLAAFGGDPSLGGTGALCATTGGWNKSLLDPHVNLLRTTTEALSAVLGGCECLQIAPFDDVGGKSTAVSRRLALNVNILLSEEFGFAQPADPAGGSWYVEKLTDELARAAWTQFQDLERRGGMAECLKTGYVQAWVEKSRIARASGVASRRIALVGANLFPNLKDPPLAPLQSRVPKSPGSSVQTPKPGNGSPDRPDGKSELTMTAAVTAALQGHSANELRAAFASPTRENITVPALKFVRATEGFEAIRRAADEYASWTGSRSKVFLAKMGPPAQHKARADFSAAFFSLGGFEVMGDQTYEDPKAAAAAAGKSGAPIVVLCSTDETYPSIAPLFAQALKATNPHLLLVLAGLPADPATIAVYRAAGFDDFIHARSNTEEMLARFLKQIGAVL